MSQAPPPSSPGHAARWAEFLAPNRPALLLALGGALGEGALLAAARDNIYRASPEAWWFVPLWLAWFWFGLAWALGLAVRGFTLGTARWPSVVRRALGVALACALAALAALYLASWGMYLRTGQFANLETVRFALANPLPFAETQMLKAYLAEVRSLLVVGLALVAAPLYLRWLARAEFRPAPEELRRPRALLAVALTLGVFVALTYERVVRSQMRAEARSVALQRGLNPLLTLWMSWRESLALEPIPAVLTDAELAPRAGAAWQPPPATPASRPHVVFVKIESLRHDVVHQVHQGREIMPRLNALARAGVQFTRAYAPSTHTDYSDVSILSSLYPLRSRRHHYFQAGDPWPRTLIYDMCKQAGYATAVFSSENEKWGGKDAFLITPGLDRFHDAERSGAPTRVAAADSGFAREIQAGELKAGVLDDAQTTDAALQWLREQQRAGGPVFLFLNLQTSHFPYHLPPGAAAPFQPAALDAGASFMGYPPEQAEPARNAYFNALAECDRQLGRLLDALSELQATNTVLAIFGDHGEAFHENGHVTHAREPVEPVARTAFVLHAPGRLPPRAEDYPVELTDLAPTVLAALGWPPHPNFQGRDALAADRPPLERRLVFLHTENPLTRTDAVWRAGRWKFTHDRATGREALFDLASDPLGRTNLLKRAEPPVEADKLRAVLARWRQRQLAYYHYPHYHERAWPPKPPQP
jgi:arylsulfatase A-like enzyme